MPTTAPAPDHTDSSPWIALSELLHRWVDGELAGSSEAVTLLQDVLGTTDDPHGTAFELDALFRGTVGVLRLRAELWQLDTAEDLCRAAAEALEVDWDVAYPPPVDPRPWVVRAAARAAGVEVAPEQMLACLLSDLPADADPDQLLADLGRVDDERVALALLAASHLLLGMVNQFAEWGDTGTWHRLVSLVVGLAEDPASRLAHVDQQLWDEVAQLRNDVPSR